jgi:hypothetical protein
MSKQLHVKCFRLAFPFISALLISSSSYAWSNYFRFVNNFNKPLVLTINPTLANVNNSCFDDINHIEVNPHELSCEFEFTTEKEKWYSSDANKGTMTLSIKDEPGSYCTYSYNYTYTVIPYNYFNIHSENFYLQSCHGNLKANEISFINDKIKSYPRPLADNIILGMDKSKAYQLTESLSQADCGGEGGDNCMIASPDLNTNYLNNGSTLAQSIKLQTELDQFEPLNFAQFIGSHNSAVSRVYTNSSKFYNLSYADPGNYMSITDQLNSGVRQVELDLEWYSNAVTICHDNPADTNQILCEGNQPLHSVIPEIKSWVEKNPNAFIFLYLDVHSPLAGHVNDLDNELSQLEPYIFTPAMAEQNYHVSNNTLPANQITKYDITHKFKKNIIVTNDDDVENLKSSRYAFVNVQNTKTKPLYEIGVDSFLQSSYADCSTQKKYENIKQAFNQDPEHNNIFRLNADRTVINYIVNVKDHSPENYNDYLTVKNIPGMLMCPVNMFSTNMLGYTCDNSDCNSHPTDPRIYSFLWSWSLGYPLQADGGNIAYINPNAGHFENNKLKSNETYPVLCNKSNIRLTSPVASFDWYIVNMRIVDIKNIHDEAQVACKNSGGSFATPTVSYAMHDVMSRVNAAGVSSAPVIVNYQRIDGQWLPNK